MMRFNNEDERVSDASFLFLLLFLVKERVRPRGVVVVVFGAVRSISMKISRFLRIFSNPDASCRSVLTKNEKHA